MLICIVLCVLFYYMFFGSFEHFSSSSQFNTCIPSHTLPGAKCRSVKNKSIIMASLDSNAKGATQLDPSKFVLQDIRPAPGFKIQGWKTKLTTKPDITWTNNTSLGISDPIYSFVRSVKA